MDAIRELQEFADAARGFCAWCEGPAEAVTDANAAYWLARLYSTAVVLPEVEPENDKGLPELASAGLERAKANLAPFWGRFYRQCFDPRAVSSEEPIAGDLGDDLMDTYSDVRAGLVLFDAGEQIEALWHWSFLHRIHWGQHATAALYALHCLSIMGLE